MVEIDTSNWPYRKWADTINWCYYNFKHKIDYEWHDDYELYLSPETYTLFALKFL